MHQLTNKVVIITGASSGIGYAAALLFSAEGAKLVLAARRKAKLDELVAKIRDQGGEAVAHAGDVREESFNRQLVELATERFGGLDAAFNNAGMLGDGLPVPEMTLADWHRLIDTNTTSAFLAAKYQLPAMQLRGGGSIVFTSSMVGHAVGMPGMAAYAASKAALVGMATSLATEYGPEAIRVNALLPGGTATPMADEFADTEKSREFVAGLHALKRFAHPQEIAQAALYLVSDAASFVTGTAMLVDGGISINKT